MAITLCELIEQGELLSADSYESYPSVWIRDKEGLQKWRRLALMYVQDKYPQHPQTKNFDLIVQRAYQTKSDCDDLIAILKAFNTIQPSNNATNYDEILSVIFNNFHTCARQLKRRHANRQTLEIIDEYDVQDMLHALLRLHFEDIRPEEWTPSYAGNSNRMDFLLNKEEIAIEVKMTRTGLKDKEIGEQLIVDIAKYQTHPHCKTLYCFVYDPNGEIRNPRGLEQDLQKISSPMNVKVYIRPL